MHISYLLHGFHLTTKVFKTRSTLINIAPITCSIVPIRPLCFSIEIPSLMHEPNTRANQTISCTQNELHRNCRRVCDSGVAANTLVIFNFSRWRRRERMYDLTVELSRYFRAAVSGSTVSNITALSGSALCA